MNEKANHFHLLNALNLANMALAAAMPENGAQALEMLQQKMLQGIAAYTHHPRHTYTRLYDVVWQSGSTQLLHFKPARVLQQKAIFFVPSFINRWHILDLLPNHSAVQFFVQAGYNVYVLNWASPEPSEHTFTIDDLVLRRLLPAMRHIEKTTKTCAAFGYCLGGTVLAATLDRWPQLQHTFTHAAFLATPWDFYAGEHAQDWRLSAYHQWCMPMVQKMGIMPEALVQTGFLMIDPAHFAKKFIAFESTQTDQQKNLFTAAEDWLNDPVPLAGGVALQLMQEFYSANTPHTHAWQLGYETITLKNIQTPTFVAIAAGDKIVPEPSSMALATALKTKHILPCPTGHIGMMASHTHAPKLWAALQAFVKN